MKSAGGTELQIKYLNKFVDLSKYKNINLIINHAVFAKIVPDKINILWCHHYIDQPSIQMLKNKVFVDKLDAIIFVSDWQYSQFLINYNLPKEKCFVIKNAIETTPIIKKKKNKKIRLLYSTTPWRGLNVLINSIDYLNNLRDDFVLDVYSSTMIYGDKFHEDNKKNFEELFNKVKNTKNVNYYEYVENEKILNILEDIDIYTYPSTFIETFCISALEALSKGCLVFMTDNGALKELGNNYAEFINFDSNLKKLSINYAKKLNILMDKYKSNYFEKRLKEQSEYYSNNFSWKKRYLEWENLLNKFKKN